MSDIERLAFEAGIRFDPKWGDGYVKIEHLEKFAAYVAEDCAKLCDIAPYRPAGAGKSAEAIRAKYPSKDES